MPFGKAFADAKAKGEKTFMWKGKSYAVQMAAPGQGAKKTPPAAAAAPAKPLPGRAVPGGGQISDTPMAEHTSYDEIQRLVSLVKYR
jgi:hypothetical protein